MKRFFSSGSLFYLYPFSLVAVLFGFRDADCDLACDLVFAEPRSCDRRADNRRADNCLSRREAQRRRAPSRGARGFPFTSPASVCSSSRAHRQQQTPTTTNRPRRADAGIWGCQATVWAIRFSDWLSRKCQEFVCVWERKRGLLNGAPPVPESWWSVSAPPCTQNGANESTNGVVCDMHDQRSVTANYVATWNSRHRGGGGVSARKTPPNGSIYSLIEFPRRCWLVFLFPPVPLCLINSVVLLCSSLHIWACAWICACFCLCIYAYIILRLL